MLFAIVQSVLTPTCFLSITRDGYTYPHKKICNEWARFKPVSYTPNRACSDGHGSRSLCHHTPPWVINEGVLVHQFYGIVLIPRPTFLPFKPWLPLSTKIRITVLCKQPQNGSVARRWPKTRHNGRDRKGTGGRRPKTGYPVRRRERVSRRRHRRARRRLRLRLA